MKTDALIRLMAADARPGLSLGRALALALVAGFAVAVLVFNLELGLRAGLMEAMTTLRVQVKISVVLMLTAAALLLVTRAGRPEAGLKRPALALLAPLLLITTAVGVELAVLPKGDWGRYLIGHNAAACLLTVMSMGAGPLAGMLIALRRGAPGSPGQAGAAAGLAAGAMAATLYALHCPDDSPLFVGTWYTLAIGGLTLVGWALGRRVLRW